MLGLPRGGRWRSQLPLCIPTLGETDGEEVERASRAFGYLGKYERNGATSLQDTPPRIERDSFCERGSAPGRARWRSSAHDDTAHLFSSGVRPLAFTVICGAWRRPASSR